MMNNCTPLKDDFEVEVISRGSYIDRDGDGGCQIETFTLRLNHVALNAYLLSDMMNCRGCYTNDDTGQARFEAHRAEYAARREVWKTKTLKAIGVEPGDGSVAITQVVAEVFAAVWIRELGE